MRRRLVRIVVKSHRNNKAPAQGPPLDSELEPSSTLSSGGEPARILAEWGTELSNGERFCARRTLEWVDWFNNRRLLTSIGDVSVVSENANGAEISNPRGVVEIRGDQPTRHWLCGRPVQKHKRTQDWRAGPFRSSSPRGEPQIWGVSEAMSAIRVPRTRRENTVQQRDATLPGGDLGPGPGHIWTGTC